MAMYMSRAHSGPQLARIRVTFFHPIDWVLVAYVKQEVAATSPRFEFLILFDAIRGFELPLKAR